MELEIWEGKVEVVEWLLEFSLFQQLYSSSIDSLAGPTLPNAYGLALQWLSSSRLWHDDHGGFGFG